MKRYSIIALIVLWLLAVRTLRSVINLSTNHGAPEWVQTYGGYETPSFELKEKKGRYEVRDYEPFNEIYVTQKSEKMGGSFMKLGWYIFGWNERNEQIAMTSPVLSDGKTLSFTVPSNIDVNTLPKPNNEEVKQRKFQWGLYVSMRFPGWVSQAKKKRKSEKLLKRVDQNGYEAVSEILLAQYNDPSIIPFLRRNEVLIWVLPKEQWQEEKNNEQNEEMEDVEKKVPENASIATFAGWCFRCIEAIMQETPWVYEALAGFAGWTSENPSYNDVASGKTDHREAVEVYYDENQISYEELVDIFRRNIVPTDAWGQYYDRGYQYTTAIYYRNEKEKAVTERTKESLQKRYDEPIATEILPYTNFYPAPEKHQDFYKKSKERYQQYKKGSGRS